MGLLETIALILVVLWLAGLGFHVAGAFINVLLVLAIVVFLARFFRQAA